MIADLIEMLEGGTVTLDLKTPRQASDAVPVLRSALRAEGVAASFTVAAQFVYVTKMAVAA